MGTSPDELLSTIHNESELIGMNHCDIGEQIYHNWNFSPVLCESILRHHTPLFKSDFSESGTVIFLAHFVTASDFTGRILSRMAPIEEFMNRLKLNANDFDNAGRRYSEMKRPL